MIRRLRGTLIIAGAMLVLDGLTYDQIYIVVVIAVFGFLRMNNGLTEARAARVIGAVERYQGQQGRFPERLDKLVPAFLPSVPRAKYTLMLGEFVYLASPERHTLMWVVTPAVDRRTYNFETKQWEYLD